MEIFYPADDIEVIRQMLAFFCWACAACWGWRFADFMLRKIAELRELFRK